MNNFNKYNRYKDSGVEWLGEIPEGWEIIRLKYASVINRATLSENTNTCFEINYVDIGGVTFENGIEKSEKFLFKHSPSRARRIAKTGDILISTVRTYLKAMDYISESKKDYVFSTGFAVIEPIVNIKGKFLYVFLKSDTFTGQVTVKSTGMSYPAINSSELASLFITLPPLHEQTAIAQFLDEKTANIDKAIAQKVRLIALLKERKQIMIQNAVTRGLDPNAKMKPSGVDWIGEIPESWEVTKNKLILSESKLPGSKDLPLLSVSIHSAVSTEELNDNDNIRGKIKIEDKSSYKLVDVNDIVFNMMRAWQGAIGAVKVKGMVSPAYTVSKPKYGLNSSFFEYQYRTNIFIQQMNKFSKGITDFRKRLYWNEFKELIVVLPHLSEQSKIVAHIEAASAKIDKAIGLQEKQIEKLKEYKAILIDHAVTGKIKVC